MKKPQESSWQKLKEEKYLSISLAWIWWGCGLAIICIVVLPILGFVSLMEARNFILIVAAVLAFPLAIHRMIIADNQLEATRDQLKQSEREIKRITKEAEKKDRDREFEKWEANFLILGKEPRKAMIEKLWQFAQSRPEDYHVTVMTLFCDFIRDYSDIAAVGKYATEYPRDVDADRVNLINKDNFVSILSKVINREKSKTPRQQAVEKDEGYRIDLSDTNFEHANLSGGDLTNADLRWTFWKSTDVSNMKWTKVYIEGALFIDHNGDTGNFKNIKGIPMPNQKIFVGDITMLAAESEGAIILRKLFEEQFKSKVTRAQERDWTLRHRREFSRPLPPLPKPE